MAFLPVKSDHGAVLPFEYLPAAAGTYSVGQLLNVTGGKLAAIAADQATTPPYLCMAQRKVEEAGEELPVTRVSADYIYETTLGAAASAAAVGVKLQVASGGLTAKTGAGTFEITSLDGTAAGDVVRGRWVPAAAAPASGGGAGG